MIGFHYTLRVRFLSIAKGGCVVIATLGDVFLRQCEKLLLQLLETLGIGRIHYRFVVRLTDLGIQLGRACSLVHAGIVVFERFGEVQSITSEFCRKV